MFVRGYTPFASPLSSRPVRRIRVVSGGAVFSMSEQRTSVQRTISGEHRRPRLVVGVGASAGGQWALERLFASAPAGVGLAFVVVAHLDPSHESLLAELLDRHTELTVFTACDGSEIVPDRVYVIEPGTRLYLEGTRLRAIASAERDELAWPIDALFESMARQRTTPVAAILLTGYGRDGVVGLHAIRDMGGLTIVQRPESARFPSMPCAAIDSGAASLVLDVEEIPAALIRHIEREAGGASEAELSTGELGPPSIAPEHLQRLARMMKARGVEISSYKPQTLRRRLWRRMGLSGHVDPESYLDHLETAPDELEQVRRDLSIRVTEFFRDAQAFAILEDAIDDLVLAHPPGEPLRVWVAGCATGEEAYSTAIILREKLEKYGKLAEVRIFATDSDAEAIVIARTGVYGRGIGEAVSPERLQRFFAPHQGGYRVRSVIRDMICFAVHDLTRDAPFSRLHLVTCRNVLIYLRPTAQARIHRLLALALCPGGLLFLGPSESMDGAPDFERVSSRWRIYRRVGTWGCTGPSPSGAREGRPEPRCESSKAAERRIPRGLTELLHACIPAAVVVDADDVVVYVHGRLTPWLEVPEGEPRASLGALVRDHLRTRVRSALHRARTQGETVVVEASTDPERHLPDTRVTVTPVDSPALPGGLVLAFEALPKKPVPELDEAEEGTLVRHLRRELQATREDLDATIEALEQANEGLRAAHEERLSMNEELQSTKEELEVTGEELRSMNEELTIVNARLKEKIEQLHEAHDDLASFFASSQIATIFLDEELRLRRASPAADALLRIGRRDIGRPVGDLGRDLLGEALEEECKDVLELLTPKSRELSVGQRWFLRRVLPYRTALRHIRGVVVTFTEMTETKTAMQRVAHSEQEQAVVAHLGVRALAGEKLQVLMDQAVREIQRTLGADYCKILELSPSGEDLLLRAGVGWREGLVGRARVSASLDSQAGYTLLSDRPVIVDDMEREGRFFGSRLLVDHGIRSGISCGIRGPAGPYGVLGAHSRTPGAFRADDANFLVAVANVLGTALGRREQEELRRQLAAIVEFSEDAIFSMDIDGTIRTWNRGAERLYGYTAAEACGKPVTINIPPELPDEFPSIMARLSRGERIESFETVRLRKDGSQVDVSVTISPVQLGEHGEVVGAAVVARDVTRQKEAQRTLEAADRHKDEYLAMLGHELRNPLAALLNAVQLQNKLDADDPRQARARAVIERQTNHMSRLVDGLLDVSRIARGKIALTNEPVDVRGVVEHVTHAWRSTTDARGIELRTSTPDRGVWVTGDETRLTQILDNLMSNAVKFTQEGGTIGVNLRVETSGKSCELVVEDDGVGMDNELLATIFQPFRQARQNLDRALGGLGLGLSLVKGLVELHGGEVSATSSGPGRGATFCVRLPLLEGRGDDATTDDDAVEGRATEHTLRVLVVEDSRDAAEMLESALTLIGHTAAVAHTGPQGIEMATKFRPDVVLCDIGLPGGVTGYDVARKLRSHPETRDMRLVALTGYGRFEDREAAYAAGFDAHLTKPVDLQQIERVLTDLRSP